MKLIYLFIIHLWKKIEVFIQKKRLLFIRTWTVAQYGYQTHTHHSEFMILSVNTKLAVYMQNQDES